MASPNQPTSPAELSRAAEYVRQNFEHPPSLSQKHVAELEKRGISREFALASHVRTAADNEIRRLNFQASLPVNERARGLQGICFTYRDPCTGEEIAWRLKPDTPFTMGDGRQAKYLSRIGDQVRAYFPHTCMPDMIENTKVNAIITEGEFKALAIAEAMTKASKRLFLTFALQGVNGGWHREKKIVPTADGGKERKSYGPTKLIDDLDSIAWHRRTVYIVFDSDVGSKKHASEFKRSKYAGAWGAEYTLAQLLRAKGAEVRIVLIPDSSGDGSKIGADDYIARHGPHEFLKLLWNSWTAERNPDEVLYQEEAKSFTFIEARELVNARPARPTFVIDRLLPEGGTCMVAASPKIGKSGIALNAALSVVQGKPFLGQFQTRQGRAVCIQTEIPDWAMSERLGLMGPLPEGLLIFNPGRLKLNLWEEDGFQKRRETGNRERVAALIEALKNTAASLVIFDPLRHFHSLNELKVEHVAHMFELFRGIGRAVPCGVMIVHHHRKIARAMVQYEGAEDMSGSGALFGEADTVISIYAKKAADDTHRLKMVFDCRHCETPKPLEVIRLGGDNAMLFETEQWRSGIEDEVIPQHLERVWATLSLAPKTAKEVGDVLRIDKSTASRNLRELVKRGKIKRTGNIYEIIYENGDSA